MGRDTRSLSPRREAERRGIQRHAMGVTDVLYINSARHSGRVHPPCSCHQSGGIYGVTIRVGHFFRGCADLLDDLLFNVKKSGNKEGKTAEKT